VKSVSELSYPLRFPSAFNKAEYSFGYLARGVPNASSLETELRNLREALLMDVEAHSYLYVHSERKQYVDNPALLGKEVLQSFPSAEPDLIEAGNCLAAECNTAAVFHLMRVVEWGLRALCSSVGLIRLRKAKRTVTPGQGGKKAYYVPVPYSQWEDILNQLQDKIDAKLKRLKRGRSKQKDQEFYYPVLQDIKAIRDAWRNHVMHTRAEYNHEDANAILTHVKRIMQTLASRVREV
jgi:hypothetical protein